MTVLEHPVFLLVRSYLRVGNARQNVSVLQPPDEVRAAALEAEVDCCACGAKIRCFRVREKSERARVRGTPEERRLFYAGTCPSEASPGCSRTRAAKDHKAALVRALGEGAHEREPVAVVEVRDAFGKVLWRHAAVVTERVSVGLRGLEIAVVPLHEVDAEALRYALSGGYLDQRSTIQTCDHLWPFPAGWNRATDAERREKWPEFCRPCRACSSGG